MENLTSTINENVGIGGQHPSVASRLDGYMHTGIDLGRSKDLAGVASKEGEENGDYVDPLVLSRDPHVDAKCGVNFSQDAPKRARKGFLLFRTNSLVSLLAYPLPTKRIFKITSFESTSLILWWSTRSL